MKAPDIDNLIKKDYAEPFSQDRRKFLKNLGGGIIITFSLAESTILKGAIFPEDEPDFNAYLRIKEDGRVDCYTGKVEMGQGVYTSIAQVLAEELEVSIDKIDMIMGDTELCPYDAGTWGSLTTRFFDPKLRAAAAEARMVLVELAADQLNVPVDQLMAENGEILDKKNQKNRIPYSQLTMGKKIIKSSRNKPDLKKPRQFKKVGKPLLRQDALQKVKGEAKYAGDIRLPGMLYAGIKRPPAYGAKLIESDTSSIDDLEGIEIVKEDDFLAVLHPSFEVMRRALAGVKAKWDIPSSKATNDTIFDYLVNIADKKDIEEEKGNLKNGKENSEDIFEHVYRDGYKAHATIETHTATAEFKEGKLTMWVSTQSPFGTRNAVAGALSLPTEKVHVKQIFIGGGFGGKAYNLQAIEAGRLAKLVGKPVQLIWTREEEFLYDTYRPAAVVKITSGISTSGRIMLWDYGEYFAGTRGASVFYDIPNFQVSDWRSEKYGHPFGTGAWRAPGNNTNTFARESQIDIMAHQAGIDPVEFRLKNLTDERMIGVVKAAVEKYGWNTTKLSSGRGRGIALGIDAGSYVALITEVEVNKNTGEVKVLKVVCAQDMGQVVNPQGAILQVEGCIVMGLGYALTEDINFDWSEIKTKNFDTYDITTFSMTPPIETVLIEDMDKPPQGGGEPAIVCVGGAIANAIYDACGARVFQMPMTPKRVLEALA